MAENFANEYQTTLNGAIDASQTSIVVTSATGAPTANFRLRIDDEYMLVTNVAGTTFTVTRALEGSTGAAHSNGATVTHVLTAGGLEQAILDAGAAVGWVLAKSSNQTLTSGVEDTITWDVAEVDGGESAIDLANDRWVCPTTDRYLVHGLWKWETTVPATTSTSYGMVEVNGTDSFIMRDVGSTPGTFGERSGFGILHLSAGDLVTMTATPGSVSGVVARGTGSTHTRSKLSIARLGGGAGAPALGQWQSYTPDWTAGTTNPTIGNGTINGRYKLLDSKTMAIQVNITMGSTTTYGSGHWFVGLPSGVTSGALRQIVPAWFVDQGTRHYVAGAYCNPGAIRVELIHTESGAAGTVTNTNPFTWANTDYLNISGILEIA